MIFVPAVQHETHEQKSPLWDLWDFQGSSCTGHSGFWASEGYRRGKAPETSAEEASRWLWIIHGVACQGLINLGWVAQAMTSDDLRLETPHDPGFITNDVSKLHHSGVSHKFKMIISRAECPVSFIFAPPFSCPKHLLEVLCVDAVILQRQGGHFLLKRPAVLLHVFVSLPDEAPIPKHIRVCLSMSAWPYQDNRGISAVSLAQFLTQWI